MKRVININFQGRVIPIEDTAYDMLKRYVDSLRVYFANEDGRDEIINDIEGRIAELFGETLKKGSTCITDADVIVIINSIGRPEDFDGDEARVQSQLAGGEYAKEESSYNAEYRNTTGKRLYRDENNKVIAGVCSGVANYFGIDPVVVRILAILTIGVTLIPYIILWIVIPSSSSTVIGSQRKRLFRDPDNKLIAGVSSGLAQYFHINVWIPRVLFLIPFISFVFRSGHWGWWDFPHFISWSFSPTSIFVYIILWLVIPEAKSAADRLEMKGEKVDLNNIKTTIQSDLEGLKDRAKTFGTEVKEKAQTIGDELGAKGKQFAGEAEPAVRRGGRGIGDFIVLIVKIFAYFVLGVVLFAIVVSLFSIGVAVTGLLPAKDYILHSGWQSFMAWGTLIFFIWVPVIGIITFIIRRIARKRGHTSLITYSFIALWVLGWICLINLIISVKNDFRYRNNPVEEAVTIANPAVNKMEVKVQPFGRYYNQPWLKLEPFAMTDADTVFVRNTRVRIIKSDNDSFQVYVVKLTNGRTRQEAQTLASKINFNIRQRDTALLLDKGIAITPNEKFRNQQVILTIAVPVGKRIKINDNVGWGHDVSLNIGDDDYWDWENNMESVSYSWSHNVEYVMTPQGLERLYKDRDRNKDDDWNDDDSQELLEEFRRSREQIEREKEEKLRELQEIEEELRKTDSDSTRYRFEPKTPNTPANRRIDINVSNTSTNQQNENLTDLLFIKYRI